MQGPRPQATLGVGEGWQKAGVAAMGLLALAQLWLVAPYYFADEALRLERILVATMAFAQVVRALRPLRLTTLHTGAWLLLLPAQSLLAAALTVAPSRSVAIYAWLLYVAGLFYWIGGSALAKRCAPPLAGVAALAFLPRAILGPLGEGLLHLLLVGTKVVLGWLFSDVSMVGAVVYIGQRPVSFSFSCSGYDFMMTYVAVCLTLWTCGRRFDLLLREVLLAMVLAFTLNLSRVITMIALSRAGYWELALGWGHLWLGGAFIFAGALVLMRRLRWIQQTP